MANTEASLAALKQLRADLANRANQIGGEYESLLQTDPFGAEKKRVEGVGLIQGIGEVDQKIQEYQDKVFSELETGDILTRNIREVGGNVPTDSRQITSVLSNALSIAFDEPVDLTTGVDAKTRGDVAFARDQDKEIRLKENGYEPVRTVNVLGSPVRIVRDQSGKLLAADEIGFSFKDVIDGIGQVAPITGSILGGIAGAATFRTPLGASTLSATGYTAAASAQDAIYRSLTNTGPGFLDAIPERATEAAIGFGVEYPLTKAMAPIGTAIVRSKKGVQPERQALLEKDEAFLKSRGYDINLSRIAAGGAQKQEKRLQLAMELPTYQVGKDVLYGAQRLERLKNSYLTPVQKQTALYQDTIQQLRHERDMLEGTLSLYDKDMAKLVRMQYDDEIYNLINRPQQDRTAAGDYLFSKLKEGEKKATALKDELYTPFYQKTEDMGLLADPIEVAKAVEGQYYSQISRNPALQSKIDDLRARPVNAKKIQKIDELLQKGGLSAEDVDALNLEKQRLQQLSGPLNMRQLDTLVQEFRDAVPDTGLVGAAVPKRVAGKASQTIQGFRDDLYRKAGIYDEWSAITPVYQQRLGFEEQQLGSLLRETLGRSDLTGSQIIQKTLSDPRITQDVLRAVELADPDKAYGVALSLQQSYLEDIGLGGRLSRGVSDFDFDPEIVTRIFGFNKEGQPNGIYGERMVQKLQSLKEAVKKADVDPSRITQADLVALEGTLSQNSIDDLNAAIIQRLKEQKKLDDFKSSSLMDAASKGHREVITAGEFPEVMWRSNPEAVKKMLGKFGPKDQAMLRADYIEHFFGRYPAKESSSWGNTTLWDGKKFLDDIRKKPSIESNLRAVVGDEFADDIIAASNVMQVIKRPSTVGNRTYGGGVVSPSGYQGFLSLGLIINPVKNRIAGAAYRVQNGKLLKDYLKTFRNKELTPEQAERTTNVVMGGLISSSQGIQALTQSGKYDPQWSTALGQLFGTIPQEKLEYRQKFGTQTEPEIEEAIK